MNCDYPNCKNHKTCNLKQPTTKKHLLLSKEIGYWLNELKTQKKRIKEYENVLKDIITHHKYSTPVNVYGHIEYAPKKNIFGVYIRRPEHVYYGWNWNKLNKIADNLTNKIRKLRWIEHNINSYSIDEVKKQINEVYKEC